MSLGSKDVPAATSKRQPVPPGVIRPRPSPAAVPDTQTTVPKAGTKLPWYRRRKGKRDMLRTVSDHANKEQGWFARLHEDPEEEAPKLSVYPSSDFLVNAEPYLLSRYANFLLQSILMLARVFQVPKHLNVKSGLGCSTSARLALLMMRTRDLENVAARRLTNLTRHLYARVIQESEDRDKIQATVVQEWMDDRMSNVQERLDYFLEVHVAPKILAGEYPKTNFAEDITKQWDSDWKVLCVSEVVREL